jgi:adenylosuccinate synthase
MSAARGLRAFAVVDLGFGDAGKGLVTDFLTRRTGADVVVRFNGGAQAGHNVVTADGRHHTFSQLGAGSFVPGVRTFLARDVVVHPTALLREVEVLEAKGVARPLARLALSGEALLVTPFHQAANRLRELARGEARHGSVGVGVGEAVHGAQVDPDSAVHAHDLGAPARLARKLASVRERLYSELRLLAVQGSSVAADEWRIFEAPEVAARWMALAEPVAACVTPNEELARWLANSRAVVFEGAQGLLLDETFGFHPHTTWSDCTPNHARRLLAEAAPGAPLRTWGVLRAHAVRHGPGPLPTEDAALHGLVVEHNRAHPWQGPVRYGWFDAVLARYALARTPELDTLVVTHVDALCRRARWWHGVAYDVGASGDFAAGTAARDGRLNDLPLAATPTLAGQAHLGALLAACRAVLEPAPADEQQHLAALEERLGRSIGVTARGPTAGHVEVHGDGAASAL